MNIKPGYLVKYVTQVGDGSGTMRDINNLEQNIIVLGLGGCRFGSGLLESDADFYGLIIKGGIRNLYFRGVTKVICKNHTLKIKQPI